MNLSQKIYQCRKQAGLSQEALAERLSVSRQAVSKWETGESVPEPAKLLALARAFGVTTDYLLDDGLPEEPVPPEPSPEAPSEAPRRFSPNPAPSAGNQGELTGLVGWLFRKWGWLAGVYVALCGVPLTLFGAVAKVMGRSASSAFENMSGGFGGMYSGDFGFGPGTQIYIDGQPAGLSSGGSFRVGSPISTVGNIFLFLGVAVILAGIALALWLKGKGERS